MIIKEEQLQLEKLSEYFEQDRLATEELLTLNNIRRLAEATRLQVRRYADLPRAQAYPGTTQPPIGTIYGVPIHINIGGE